MQQTQKLRLRISENFLTIHSLFLTDKVNLKEVEILLSFKDKGPYSQSYGFSSSHVWIVRVGLWRRPSAEELMLLNCGAGEDSWQSLGLQGDQTSQS